MVAASFVAFWFFLIGLLGFLLLRPLLLRPGLRPWLLLLFLLWLLSLDALFAFLFSIFSTGASAAFMTVAGRFGFSAQGFEFVPGLDFVAVERDGVVAFIVIEQDEDGVTHRHHVRDFAFAARGNNPFVALGQFLARRHVLLIFVDEATAQASAHARDLVGR